MNAVIGCWQEGKAEESVAALKQMLHVQAKMWQDGNIVEVPAEELIVRFETNRIHFNHIYPKFEVPSLLQASALAIELNLVKPARISNHPVSHPPNLTVG